MSNVFPGTPLHTSPGSYARAITPSDTDVLPEGTRGIYVGTGGDLALVLAGDSSPVTFVAVPAGSLLPLAVIKVMSAGTTATNLVGVI